MAPNQGSAAIGVAWRRPDGTPQVQLVDYRPGVAWLAARVSHLRATWSGTWLLDPRGASGSQAAGWPGEILTPNQARRSCVELEAAVHARQLGHFAQPELRAALEGAVKRPQEDGGWSWARNRTTHRHKPPRGHHARPRRPPRPTRRTHQEPQPPARHLVR